jgi:hypothetical protein
MLTKYTPSVENAGEIRPQASASLRPRGAVTMTLKPVRRKRKRA